MMDCCTVRAWAATMCPSSCARERRSSDISLTPWSPGPGHKAGWWRSLRPRNTIRRRWQSSGSGRNNWSSCCRRGMGTMKARPSTVGSSMDTTPSGAGLTGAILGAVSLQPRKDVGEATVDQRPMRAHSSIPKTVHRLSPQSQPAFSTFDPILSSIVRDFEGKPTKYKVCLFRGCMCMCVRFYA